jgi:hypothetical protein
MGVELFHTDRHDEANSRFSQFCESAQQRNMVVNRYSYFRRQKFDNEIKIPPVLRQAF